MIKKYTTADEDKLKKLITTLNVDSDSLYLTKSPNYICSYAAYEKEEMVALIVAWKSSFHPFCTYFKIISHPEYTALGELIAEVEQNGMAYPLQTGVDEGTVLDHYYLEQDFDLIRKTYLPKINLSNSPGIFSMPNNVKTIHEISSNATLVTNLVSLVKRIYEETHTVNPVAEFELEKWREMIFAEDLLAEGSYVCLDKSGEEVLAYSFLHEAETNDTVELGWVGSRTIFEMEYIISLVGLQMAYAKQKGYQFMEGEFDTTDPYAMNVLSHFTIPINSVLNTYQKKS
ncbi:hypothetical protein [Paucisalibacillus globulus]|uniref:hypothetical protein n=1 Tax=Paucisalibacillus globulus TaxID=351095 RepID=UPI00041BCBC7|nr:hypothetical protein [Paucisalibacillus globulus]